MPFPYKIEVVNSEMEIYSVVNTKNNNYYELTKRGSDGGFDHAPRCKAQLVYGDNFLCRHKKMVLGKFYAAEEYRYLFNISPKRRKSNSKKSDGKGSEDSVLEANRSNNSNVG